MILDQRPFETLLDLASRGATGELIAASQTAEVHVFLQRGRVAWATDSEHPFAFTRRLQKTAQIDADAFRDILESCKREKRPLGETLVSWGVATPDEVKDALRHQVELALEVLRSSGPAQTVFLDRTRQFAQYDSGLTFDVGELGAERVAARPTSHPASVPAGPMSAPPSQYARRLLDSLEGLLWTELHEGTATIDAAPEPSRAERFPASIIEHSVLDGAELAVLRSTRGTLAGVALPASRSLWCRLGAEVTLGAAVAALAAFGASPRRSSSDLADGPARPTTWTIGDEDAAPLRELREFRERAPETLAAIVTGAGAEPWAYAAGSSAVDRDWALDLVTRRANVLGAPELFGDEPPPAGDEDVAFHFRSVLTVEPKVWCFGAELATRPRCVLWLLLARQASQGLGWAYLTSLSRQLLHVRDWGRRA
jgi:hypothetical protein